MFGDGVLTFREFAVADPLPLATVQEAVLEFLRARDDAVLFGAQAVNAYVDEPRMTQDIDVMSTCAETLAEEIRAHLAGRFHIAVRVRKVGSGSAFRVFQIRQPKNRHLVDLRSVPALPPARRLSGILVVQPAELIAQKVIAYHRRRGQPKAGTDWRDVAELLLAFPDLKAATSEVYDRLAAAKADEAVMTTWGEFVARDLRAADDEEY